MALSKRIHTGCKKCRVIHLASRFKFTDHRNRANRSQNRTENRNFKKRSFCNEAQTKRRREKKKEQRIDQTVWMIRRKDHRSGCFRQILLSNKHNLPKEDPGCKTSEPADHDADYTVA